MAPSALLLDLDPNWSKPRHAPVCLGGEPAPEHDPPIHAFFFSFRSFSASFLCFRFSLSFLWDLEATGYLNKLIQIMHDMTPNLFRDNMTKPSSRGLPMRSPRKLIPELALSLRFLSASLLPSLASRSDPDTLSFFILFPLKLMPSGCSSLRFCLRSSISWGLSVSVLRAAPLPIFTGFVSGFASPSVSAAFPQGISRIA